VAHAVKGGDGEEEDVVDAAAALPHAVAPLGAPSVFCCGGFRSAYCCSGAEESKGGVWEEEKDGEAPAASPHAVAPVGAPIVYSCGGAEERKGCDGDKAATCAHAVAPVGATSAAAAGLYGEWRGYSKSGCCAEQRMFRADQVTRCDSVARRATFNNWRLAAEQRSQMAWSVTIDMVS
jgi:hypothetical protein